MLSDRFICRTSEKSDGNMAFRFGSADEVLFSRRHFLSPYGIELKNLAVMQVEYGERIVMADEHLCGTGAFKEPGVLAEALMTKEKNLFLFLPTADCLPVAYCDPVQEVIALAHLGWKPTMKRVAPKVIQRLSKDCGTKPEDILVSIGPGIHKESYRFVNPMQKDLPEWKPFLHDLPGGDTEVDLVGFNVAELVRAGVLESNIEVSPFDTAKSPDFFSHYRSVRTGEPEGRFATVLGMR